MHIHHYQKTYSKTSNSKWNCPATDPSCRKSIAPGEAQYCESNTAKRKQPINNFLPEDSKEPLSKNIGNNQLIQNEFVSQFITGFSWARDKAKLSSAGLTRPKENQPTISRSKLLTKETIIGTQEHTPLISKRVSHNGSQLSKNQVSKRGSVLRG